MKTSTIMNNFFVRHLSSKESGVLHRVCCKVIANILCICYLHRPKECISAAWFLQTEYVRSIVGNVQAHCIPGSSSDLLFVRAYLSLFQHPSQPRVARARKYTPGHKRAGQRYPRSRCRSLNLDFLQEISMIAVQP